MTWGWYRFAIQTRDRHDEMLEWWPWFPWVFRALLLIPIGITLLGLFLLLVQPSRRCWIDDGRLNWESHWCGIFRRCSKGQIELDRVRAVKAVLVRGDEETDWFRLELEAKDDSFFRQPGLKAPLTRQQCEEFRRALEKTAPGIEFSMNEK